LTDNVLAQTLADAYADRLQGDPGVIVLALANVQRLRYPISLS